MAGLQICCAMLGPQAMSLFVKQLFRWSSVYPTSSFEWSISNMIEHHNIVAIVLQWIQWDTMTWVCRWLRSLLLLQRLDNFQLAACELVDSSYLGLKAATMEDKIDGFCFHGWRKTWLEEPAGLPSNLKQFTFVTLRSACTRSFT